MQVGGAREETADTPERWKGALQLDMVFGTEGLMEGELARTVVEPTLPRLMVVGLALLSTQAEVSWVGQRINRI